MLMIGRSNANRVGSFVDTMACVWADTEHARPLGLEEKAGRASRLFCSHSKKGGGLSLC